MIFQEHQKLDIKNLKIKWGPILESLNFKEEHKEKLAEYCEWHTLIESTDLFSTMQKPSTLNISLKILSKLDNLDKISFQSLPYNIISINNKCIDIHGILLKPIIINSIVGTFQYSIKEEKFYDDHYGLNTLNHHEDSILMEIVPKLNDIIKKCEKVFFYQVISEIRRAASEFQDSINPVIYVRSRFYEYNKKNSVTIDDL